jgi:DNA-binding phage protein
VRRGRVLSRDIKHTVVARVQRERAFARALLDEAATLLLNGEPETTRLILRDLVNDTIGFEKLAGITETPSKSLRRMLAQKGNPSMDQLAAIVGAIRHNLNVGLKVRLVATTEG